MDGRKPEDCGGGGGGGGRGRGRGGGNSSAVSYPATSRRLSSSATVMPASVALDSRLSSATRAPESMDHVPASTRKRSVFHRRMELWDDDLPPDDENGQEIAKLKYTPGSIFALPVDVQVTFRRKVLLVFSMQLAVLTAITALLTFEPSLSQLMHDAFPSWLYLLIAVVVMSVLLVVLYLIHSRHPWNWIALLIFSISFGVLIAGVQVITESHAGLFCCLFTLAAVGIVTILCSTKRGSDANGPRFISASVAGLVSFTVVAIVSGVLTRVYAWDSFTGRALVYSLVLEFVLIMWFSYDANTIFKVLTPDEYMHGVIYFYTDVIMLAVFSALIGGVVLLCSAVSGGNGGGFSGIGYCNFNGCSGGCCCGDTSVQDSGEDLPGYDGNREEDQVVQVDAAMERG